MSSIWPLIRAVEKNAATVAAIARSAERLDAIARKPAAAKIGVKLARLGKRGAS